ncbi:ABC transporter ATP-binding protein [Metallococcus carri]|uniref:ABC transporter ATP-binding protein n=1 Tax=Metallococcus carri TaxID=1656884 RepID=UPI002E2AFAF1|nr:ABC transporter ATP-binding protein [Metallococcus carri]
MTKTLAGQQVLRGVSFDVPAGSVAAVVGPSGCGKTTLLRCIAGFETPTSGTVTIDGREVSGAATVPPHKRGVGYVAQDGALFPHLTVKGNVGFGLPRRDRTPGRIASLLEAVSLDPALASRRPHELSGGQQQRVALARAIALRPKVMLLDEPFSALDTGLRARTRESIGAVLRDAGITTVLVTHDQAEALSFADQVAVMSGGSFRQVGAPTQLYTEAIDLDTARFLGETIELSGVVSGSTAHTAFGDLPVVATEPGEAVIMLRPSQVRLVRASGAAAATVSRIEDQGDHQHVILAADGVPELLVDVPSWDVPQPGERVSLSVSGAAIAYPGSPAHA